MSPIKFGLKKIMMNDKITDLWAAFRVSNNYTVYYSNYSECLKALRKKLTDCPDSRYTIEPYE